MDAKSKDRLERPKTIKTLWILLYSVCGLTVVAEFFVDRHPHFAIDKYFGFYAGLGFIACAILIIVAKGIGFLLKRKEDYYNG